MEERKVNELILQNKVYIGNLCMNLTGTWSYKDPTHIHNTSEWIQHENIHAAIIPSETWEKSKRITYKLPSQVTSVLD